MSPNATKTGIVIVSYNASEAVRITLASVRRAHNDAAFELVVVDNASDPAEREKIRTAMSRHIAEVGPAWRYIEQDRNLGFAGGNNVGISAFLADESISHVCLLNSDVIVTDHWLDRLLASRCDIVSAVTNKADGEQCVPVDYDTELGECLHEGAEDISDRVYGRISDFAERWHTAWRGNLVDSDVTFFCVLLSKAACRNVGLLDETFFPGGFEDDDYCLRARNAGYPIHLARDVFIHHWGSASFGQLQYEYFSTRAQRNKDYLEEKHGIKWVRRPEKPIVSFAMDINFALQHGDRSRLQTPFIELYLRNLSRQIDYFESEYRNLRNALTASGRDMPEALVRQVQAADAYGDVRELWDGVVRRTADALAGVPGRAAGSDSLRTDLERVAAGVHDRVECNFAIHAFITGPDPVNSAPAPDLPPPAAMAPAFAPRPTTRLGKFFWILSRGLGFILRFNGIVFFGGYFYPERQSDGYFQRIQIVDRLFSDRWRVYVESDELRGRNVWFDRPEPNVLVLRIIGTKKRRILVRMLALMAVLRSRKIYFHSVLRMYDNRFGKLLYLPFLRKAVDIHGVVPEEFRMHDDFFSAVLYEKEERLAVKRAGIVIVVTDAMRQYLQQKFRDALRAEVVAFPMFPSFTPTLASRPLLDGKPIVVYAGGLHKWQQVPKMIDAILRTADRFNHRFYCPEPQVVKAMLPSELSGVVTVESKAHTELMSLYPECHYGFILREDIIVNRVACPTKLVEYLAMGIVPIVDCEDIGDFKALGMHFIRLDDFLAGRLPDEVRRVEMAVANFSVYERLKEVRQSGAERIHAFFTPEKAVAGFASRSLMEVTRRLLPPNSALGRMARKARRAFMPPDAAAPLAGPDDVVERGLEPGVPERLLPCDILVQVDNFEAGGLENVVIDLNGTLADAGYRVVLLVLGNQGAAVARARELGQKVICRAYSEDSHADLVEQLQPKLVMAHYSFRGVDLYKARAIPFVQVIHNIYMWLDEAQRRDFAQIAAATTQFIAVSDDVKNYSVARLGVPLERCTVISNGIDLNLFRNLDREAARARLRATHGIADDEFVFLDVGAINHQKNHLGTIRAFEFAVQTCGQVRLAILGPCYEPALLQEMLAYVEKRGLQDKVLYCGVSAGVHEYLAMADAFVTATFFEGGPLTLLEAIAANLPVVMPAVGVASSFAGRRGVELVAPCYDMARYGGAIWELVSTPEFEQRLAAAMVCTWRTPVRPNFTQAELGELDRRCAYARYVKLLGELVRGESVPEKGAAALTAA